jgi:hypothetical protein
MSEIRREKSLGPLAGNGEKPALDNAAVKGYANVPTIVPENFYILLAVQMPNVSLHFGDEFGDMIFLAAVYHPYDVHGLPTGILVIDTPEFTKWLYPANSESSIEPKPEVFCYYGTEDFLKSIESMDQLRLETRMEKDAFKNAIKIFITYFRTLKGLGTEHYRQCLGIAKDNSDKDDDDAKVELTEAEKQALEQSQGKRKSLRSTGKTFYGPKVAAYYNKVPVGSIPTSASSGTVKQPGDNLAQPYGKKTKVQPVIEPEIADLRTRGQKAADTKAANKLADETRIKEAVLKQVQAMQKQQVLPVQQAHFQPSLQNQSAKGFQQQQQLQPQNATRVDHRADMALDFQMMEGVVKSFENYADRRFDKLISTNKYVLCY